MPTLPAYPTCPGCEERLTLSVGLPVTVTFGPRGTLDVEVDLSELSASLDDIGPTGSSSLLCACGTIDADEDLVDALRPLVDKAPASAYSVVFTGDSPFAEEAGSGASAPSTAPDQE